MEKRLPFAILLSLLFAWVYLGLNQESPPPETADGGGLAGDANGAFGATGNGAGNGADPFQGMGGENGAGAPAGQGAGPGAGPGSVFGGTNIQSIGPDEHRQDSELLPLSGTAAYNATFETWASGLTSLELEGYTVTPNGDDKLMLLGDVDPSVPSFGLSLPGGKGGLALRNWDVQRLTRSDGLESVEFTVEVDDLRFTRTITAQPADFLFDLDVKVENIGDKSGGTLSLLLRGPQGVADLDYSSFASAPPTAIALISDGSESKLVKWTKGDLKDGDPRALSDKETLVAAGTMTNYFTSVLLPKPGTFPNRVYPMAVLDHQKLEADVESNLPANETDRERMRRNLAAEHWSNASVQVQLGTARPDPGESVTFGFQVYSGPKDRKLARQAEYIAFLEPMIEDSYGSMSWINHALLAILEFWHALTSNWGMAIILLTVLIKTLLFPLSRLQQSSMARYGAVMQKLKPEIDALKEKHKNNKQKFNQEQMRLMRDYGATPPLGGCLLMVPQMFIWISLFQVLRTSIEIRHADFAFWITDLSRPDAMPLGLFGFETLNLLPILMSGAMMLQMKYTPQAASADPQQQQMQKTMGMLMPVMMLFILYGYPAGLSLYILVSSLLGIFEYRVIRKFMPLPTADTIVLKKRTPRSLPGQGGKGGKSGKGGKKRR